jgi:hypothetical protein
MRIEVVVPVDGKDARVEGLTVRTSQGNAYTAELARAAAMHETTVRVEHRRGGVFELAIEGPIRDGVSAHVSILTFVRDVVQRGAGPGSRGFGDGGPAR